MTIRSRKRKLFMKSQKKKSPKKYTRIFNGLILIAIR